MWQDSPSETPEVIDEYTSEWRDSDNTIIHVLFSPGEVTYFFAVVAVDKEGRDVSGDISNIVAAGMTAIMSPTLAPTTEEETTVDNSPALAPTPRAWVTALLVTLGTVIALLQ